MWSLEPVLWYKHPVFHVWYILTTVDHIDILKRPWNFCTPPSLVTDHSVYYYTDQCLPGRLWILFAPYIPCHRPQCILLYRPLFTFVYYVIDKCLPLYITLQTSVYLESFEFCSHPPSLVIGQGVSVLLEQGVDSGDTSVPAVLQILQGQPPI